MRRVIVLALLLLAAASPARADDDAGVLLRQVPLLPLPPGDHDDIESLVARNWAAYWHGGGAFGFGLTDLKAGRYDLDDDGDAELFLLVDTDAWRKERGQPLVVARWGAKGWTPVGWGFADSDSVFITREARKNWHTIDTGTALLRWTGRQYDEIVK